MLIRHGDLHYALGLEWTEVEGGNPAVHLREILGKDANALYQVLGSRREGMRVGYVRELPTAATGKGKKGKLKAYSLAAVVEAVGRDGIYFLQVEERGWYGVIQAGELLRTSGDMVMPLEHAVEAARQLALALDLPIHATHPEFPNAAPFGLEDLDAIRRRPTPMVTLAGASANTAVGALLLVAVLAGIGFGGWHTFVRSPNSEASAEQQAAQMAVDQYVQAMMAAVPKLNPDAGWVIDALSGAASAFPRDASGWLLVGMSCSTEQCGATYEISDRHTIFSLRDLEERFGKSHVRLRPDGRSLVIATANANANASSRAYWEEGQFLDPPPAQVSLTDAHGLLRLRVPQVGVEQTMHRESLSQGTAPPGVAGIASESIVTSGTEAYPLPTIARLAQALAPLGFTAETLDTSADGPGRSAMWRARWTRIVRE